MSLGSGTRSWYGGSNDLEHGEVSSRLQESHTAYGNKWYNKWSMKDVGLVVDAGSITISTWDSVANSNGDP